MKLISIFVPLAVVTDVSAKEGSQRIRFFRDLNTTIYVLVGMEQ